MEGINGPELEEGEACYYMEEGCGDNNIDPDIDLSYLDKKIQNYLGHFQKDFEGVFSAENLGAKFGEYGSFLPTYERPPGLSAGGVPQILQAPATALLSLTLRDVQYDANKLHGSEVQNGNISVKKLNQEPQFDSNPIAKNPTRGGTLIKSEKGAANHSLLKVRIKVGSNKNTKTNTALYNGLGLEGSSSTSFSSSHESGGFPSLPIESSHESPAYIIKVMTSFPVPCSDFICPLDDSILSLRKVVVPENNDHAGNVKVCPRKSSVLVDQLVTVQGDALLPKLKRIKSDYRNINSVEVKNESSMMLDSKMTILEQQKVKNKMLDDEASLPYNLEKTCFSSTDNACGEPRKNAAMAYEVIGKVKNIKVRRKISTTSVNETQVIAASVPDYGTEMKKRQKITIVKTGEHGVSDTKIASTANAMENGRGKDDVYMLPKDRCHVAKNKEEFMSKEVSCLKLKVSGEASFHGKFDNDFPSQNENPLVGMKKKPKVCQSDGKDSILSKDRMRFPADMGRKSKEVYSHDVLPSKKKFLNLTSGKDMAGFDNNIDASESSNGRCNYLETPSNGVRQKPAKYTFHVVENDSVLSNSRQINTSAVISSSFSGVHMKCVEDAAAVEGISEKDPGAASLLENWVCCDLCEKWRLLPNGVKPEDLPKKWMCSMLDWLPEMNKCDIDEDMTTGIMRGVIPCPGFENLGYGNGSKIRVISSIKRLGQNTANVSTVAVDGQGMSKLGQKEMIKKNKGITAKRKSLNNTSPSLVGCNSLMRSMPENRSQDVAMGENMMKQKENSSISDTKLSKEKVKGKSIQLEFQASKRSKRDDVSNSAKLGNTDIKACSKDIGKGRSCECNSSKEENQFGGRLVVSVKKPSKQAKVSTNCTSVCLKESKFLKRSEDTQIDGEFHHQLVEDKLMAEENDQCMPKKRKSSGFSDTLIRDTGNRSGNSRPTKEGKAIKKLSSEMGIHYSDVEVEGQHLSKKRKQLVPRQATSSSSKVSGSQKSRVNYEVQGSPVESVSSSPLRVTDSAKFSSVRHDVLIRVDVPNGVLPVMDNFGVGCGEKIWANQSAIVVEKESCGFHVGSLEAGTLRKDSKSFSRFGNVHNLDSATDYPQHGEFPVNNTFQENGGYVKSGNTLPLQKNGDFSALKSNVVNRNSESDSDKDNVRTCEEAVEKVSKKNWGRRYDYLVKVNNAPSFGKIQNHMDPEIAKKKVKNQACKDLPEHKHAQSYGGINTLYSDYGLESPSENTCPDSNCRVEDVQVSAESMSSKEMVSVHPVLEGKHGAPSQDSQLGGQRNICNRLPLDTASNIDLSKTLVWSKINGVSNNEYSTSEIDVKDVHSSSPSKAYQSVQTASAVLKEAEKLRDLAHRLKGTNFGFEGNESYFEAAVKFLQAASLLEHGHGENSKHKEATPLQVYSTAAKLFESCAMEFERCQELAAATLAYKCMEVACMRIVNCKYGSLNRDRNELQASLLKGDSPSSSTSDIDNLNNQAVADRCNLSEGSNSHVVGNHIVGQNLPSFVRLLDFTQDVNIAMEASRKSQVAFLATNESMIGSQNKELIISSVKMVTDFSFQDIDALIHLVVVARKAITRSGFTGTKD
ncbi:hypothetical protein SAY87_009411 [Trapa incisa]|uniref:CW-type domain-containing protein n=1 Tax=Trapa incisa TaxID=236973 RepID=A0AAN7JZK8_9MYRT|nr:hypothetical protein SAY87_009411 [Trapa incisa]